MFSAGDVTGYYQIAAAVYRIRAPDQTAPWPRTRRTRTSANPLANPDRYQPETKSQDNSFFVHNTAHFATSKTAVFDIDNSALGGYKTTTN